MSSGGPVTSDGSVTSRRNGSANSALPFDPIDEARRQWRSHGWSDAAEGMAAVTSLMRAHQLMLARVDGVLRPLELTFARYEVLMLLLFSRTGSLPLNVVGARLQVHPTSVTSAVDRLEAQGLVRRLRHPTDRRAVLAELTDSGRGLAQDATRVLNEQVFAEVGLEPADLATLISVVRKLRQGAGDFD
jgi:DNA-binding MarR family transcriptional regulator